MADNLSILAFKPRIILVDDDQMYLRKLSALLALEGNVELTTFNDPVIAGEALKKMLKPDLIADLLQLIPVESGDSTLQLHQVDLSFLPKLFTIAERDQHPAVVIVDQNMPKCSGEALCQRIREQWQLPVKLMMLTGYEEDRFGRDMLNNNYVDLFLKKEEVLGSVDLLLAQIQRLSERYFAERSAPYMNILASNYLSPLNDKHFMQFYRQFCQQHQLVERVMLDSNGSTFCLNADGESALLMIKSGQELKDLCQQLADEDGREIEAIYQAIQQRQHLPFLLDQAISFEDWQPYLHVANKIEDIDYYYAYTTDLSAYPLLQLK